MATSLIEVFGYLICKNWKNFYIENNFCFLRFFIIFLCCWFRCVSHLFYLKINFIKISNIFHLQFFVLLHRLLILTQNYILERIDIELKLKIKTNLRVIFNDSSEEFDIPRYEDEFRRSIMKRNIYNRNKIL